jgi:hypothetical protein
VNWRIIRIMSLPLSNDEAEVCAFLEELKFKNSLDIATVPVPVPAPVPALVLVPEPPVNVRCASISNNLKLLARLQCWSTCQLWSFAVTCIGVVTRRQHVMPIIGYRIMTHLSMNVSSKMLVPMTKTRELVPFSKLISSLRYTSSVDVWCTADICIAIAVCRPEEQVVNEDHMRLMQLFGVRRKAAAP